MKTTVIRIEDDRDVPLTGLIIGWEDEDRCLVLWGDAKYNWHDHVDEARIEFADELMPYGKGRP